MATVEKMLDLADILKYMFMHSIKECTGEKKELIIFIHSTQKQIILSKKQKTSVDIIPHS